MIPNRTVSSSGARLGQHGEFFQVDIRLCERVGGPPLKRYFRRLQGEVSYPHLAQATYSSCVQSQRNVSGLRSNHEFLGWMDFLSSDRGWESHSTTSTPGKDPGKGGGIGNNLAAPVAKIIDRHHAFHGVYHPVNEAVAATRRP